MKILINDSKENWICDRMRNEFESFFPQYRARSIDECDVVWLIAPWAISNLEPIKHKKIIFSVYHIVPDKFDKRRLLEMDKYAHAFHVICEKTKDFIKDYVTKPIFVEPFWKFNH